MMDLSFSVAPKFDKIVSTFEKLVDIVLTVSISTSFGKHWLGKVKLTFKIGVYDQNYRINLNPNLQKKNNQGIQVPFSTALGLRIPNDKICEMCRMNQDKLESFQANVRKIQWS